MRAVNREGLTFEEWCNAAGLVPPLLPRTKAKAQRAWLNGEDPSEWRAQRQGGK